MCMHRVFMHVCMYASVRVCVCVGVAVFSCMSVQKLMMVSSLVYLF